LENGWFGVAKSTIGGIYANINTRRCPSRKLANPHYTRKGRIIAAFLNECGENAKWEDWCNFLHKHQVKGFEWTESVE
jgi:hypothetical protein